MSRAAETKIGQMGYKVSPKAETYVHTYRERRTPYSTVQTPFYSICATTICVLWRWCLLKQVDVTAPRHPRSKRLEQACKRYQAIFWDGDMIGTMMIGNGKFLEVRLRNSADGSGHLCMHDVQLCKAQIPVLRHGSSIGEFGNTA